MEACIQGPILSKEANSMLSALLNETFAVPAGRAYLDDFPIWNEDFARSFGDKISRYGVFSDAGRLVAAAGVRLARLKIREGAILPVALVGAVATDAAHRGKGHASRLVQKAIDEARRQGAVAVFLWGSEHSLYRRLGFELCGKQLLLPLKGIQLPENRTDQVARGWMPSLFPLLQKRSGGLVLEGASDATWFGAHKNVEWFWVGLPGEPQAYAALGRGIDMTGLIHEWGGNKDALLRLLSTLQRNYPEAKLLGTQAHFDAVGLDSSSAEAEFLCLGKILEPRALFRAVEPSVPFEARLASGSWWVSTANGPELEVSETDLSRLFFGPEEVSAHLAMPRLPFPIWFWGLDAV